jgi:Cupredoxin-like domain
MIVIRIYNTYITTCLPHQETTHMPTASQAMPRKHTAPLKSLVLLTGLWLAASSWAADVEALLTLKNHKFEPTELKVPANQDSTPEEFESHALNREKVIPGGSKAVIFIGPLKAGRYAFAGEFNEATAKGVVIAE